MPRKLFIGGFVGFLLGTTVIFLVPTILGLAIAMLATAATLFDPLHGAGRISMFWETTGFSVVMFAICGIVVTPLLCVVAVIIRQRLESLPFYAATLGAGVALYGIAHLIFAIYVNFRYGITYISNIFGISILVVVFTAPPILMASMWCVRRWGEPRTRPTLPDQAA